MSKHDYEWEHLNALVGNEFAKSCLKSLLIKECVGNLLLFSGPDGVGKSLFAHEFARLLMLQDHQKHQDESTTKNHPDIHVYKPEGKAGMHSIATMRQFSKEVYRPPYKGNWKVFIIHDVDRMFPVSANALLKTFEEPLSQSLIILLTSNMELILPTIVSRCRRVRFQPVSTKEMEIFLASRYRLSHEQINRVAIQSRGSISRAVRFLERGETEGNRQLFSFLSKGKITSYAELQQEIKKFDERVEKIGEEEEKELREQLSCDFENLTVTQRESIEKELEGARSLRILFEAEDLFTTILTWYRDLHLLLAKGNDKYLIHGAYQERLLAFVKETPDLLPLEKVEKVLVDARISLQRSTKFSICLESLFLSLGILKTS